MRVMLVIAAPSGDLGGNRADGRLTVPPTSGSDGSLFAAASGVLAVVPAAEPGGGSAPTPSPERQGGLLGAPGALRRSTEGRLST